MRRKGASEREGERKFRIERWNACGKGKRDIGGKEVRGKIMGSKHCSEVQEI